MTWNKRLREVTLEVTADCPLNCVHCSSKPISPETIEMDFETVASVMNSLRILGGEEINITGGEPLGYSSLFKCLEIAKIHGLRTTLFTCGIPESNASLTDQALIAHELAGLVTGKVCVSLHGPSAEVHDNITNQKGSFAQAVNFIKELVKRGVQTKIHFVAMQPNFREIKEVIRLARMLGCSEVKIFRFMPQGNGRLNREWLELPIADFADFVRTQNALRRDGELPVRFGAGSDFCFLEEPNYRPDVCLAGKDRCFIKVNGDMIPCPAFYDLQGWSAGNIVEQRLEDVWRSDATFRSLREFTPNLLKGKCQSCKHVAVCEGRCPAARARKYGTIEMGPDPACPA
jgi:radical SAM protein with 4Fe4S-binding SPASM domain